MKTNKIIVRKMVLAAMFLSVGFILPMFTSQIKEIGDTLLPMHIPTMLCGLICGSQYGLFVGFLLPILRSLIFNMPPIYPNAIWMAIELATYGFVIGFVYSHIKFKDIKGIYLSLVSSMIVGRITWGISKTIFFGFANKSFTLSMFIVGGFVDALPGIILQLIFIPLIVTIVNKHFERS